MVGKTFNDRVPVSPDVLFPEPPEVPRASSGPSKFGRVLGGILGGALNLVVPGAGTAVGGLFGAASGGPDFAQMEAMITQSAWQQMQMLDLQTRVQNQTQEFTAITNLLKARHDGEMSAINNMRS